MLNKFTIILEAETMETLAKQTHSRSNITTTVELKFSIYETKLRDETSDTDDLNRPAIQHSKLALISTAGVVANESHSKTVYTTTWRLRWKRSVYALSSISSSKILSDAVLMSFDIIIMKSFFFSNFNFSENKVNFPCYSVCYYFYLFSWT